MPQLSMEKLCPVLVIKGIATGSNVGVDIDGDWWEYELEVMNGHFSTLLPMGYKGVAIVTVSNSYYKLWSQEVEIFGGRHRVRVEQKHNEGEKFNDHALDMTIRFENVPKDACVSVYETGNGTASKQLTYIKRTAHNEVTVAAKLNSMVRIGILKNGVTRYVEQKAIAYIMTHKIVYDSKEQKAFFGT